MKAVDVITRLTGWRRLLLAMLAGVFGAFALPPLYLVPVFFLAIPLLVLLIDGAHDRVQTRAALFRSAFTVGWAFGFGYFLFGFYWIGEAFLVEAEIYAWMMPFAVLLLPAGMALYWGLGTAAAAMIWQPGIRRLLALSACLTITEWLRGHLLTGFPWNLPGYILGASEALAQSAAVFGAYGLTFFALLAASLPVLFLPSDGQGIARAGRRRRIILGGAAILALTAWTLGSLRLPESFAETGQGPRVRIVQPNIEQGEKWDPRYAPQILNRFLELSATPSPDNQDGLGAVDYLVWPESALPFLIDERADIRGVIGAVLPDDVTLLTGGIRREPDPEHPEGQGIFYNSLQVIDSSGAVVAQYDKAYLVPFGEYLPFESVLRPLGFRKLVNLPAGFSAGPGPATVQTPDVRPFSPLICYEIVFPGAIVDDTTRPEWLLNVTNDAWFGTSLGPYQHFAQARFRAIEEGLPLIRAANTGISAVVDPYGRTVDYLELGKEGIIDAEIPPSIPPTIYSRHGDWVLFILVILALLSSIKINLSRLVTD